MGDDQRSHVVRRRDARAALHGLIAFAIVVSVIAPVAARATTGIAYPPGVQLRPDQPHPAVARIIVPEGEVTSYGSGTLIDVRDQFGLVITNWHVVRDGHGDVEVVFPDGFRSKARPLKVDSDWDLAALVIWRPPASPVNIAARAPQSGDQLTICGYGQGQYRAATGRCTQYYAPKADLPQHMVELDVEARQGDSGGPIFNDRGELAGVLFGAGGGTTLGSFGGRVESFLATLAPDIGRATDSALVQGHVFSPAAPTAILAATPATNGGPTALAAGKETPNSSSHPAEQTVAMWAPAGGSEVVVDSAAWQAAPTEAPAVLFGDAAWFEHGKTVLAAIGALAIVVQALRIVR
jgi:serine protease Do